MSMDTSFSYLITKVGKGEKLSMNELLELLASHKISVKKTSCYYISKHALSQPDVALLAANLLHKGCTDANPNIRSSSLIALSSLPSVDDTSIPCIEAAFSDPDPKVRRASAMACINIASHSAEQLKASGLVDLLYEGIRDSDSIVVTDCLMALETVLYDEGGIVINKKLAHYLVDNLENFNSCSVFYVLTLLRKYKFTTEDELLYLLNGLDFKLSSLCSSVLVATSNLFLNWIIDYPHMMKDLIAGIQPSVCKILTKHAVEEVYLLLEYLEKFGDGIRDVFGIYYKYFLLRTKDPIYLKVRKLAFLPLICNECNSASVISEVGLYCSDYQCYRQAVDCLVIVGQKSDCAKSNVLKIFTKLLQAPGEDLVICALKGMLTIVDFSELSDSFIPLIEKIVSLQALQETEPVLFLQVLGIGAERIKSANRLLQCFFSENSDLPTNIHCQLIKTAAQVFYSHPASTQTLLSQILMNALNSSDWIVKQKARLIYSILLQKPEDAVVLLNCRKHGVPQFEKNMDRR